MTLGRVNASPATSGHVALATLLAEGAEAVADEDVLRVVEDVVAALDSEGAKEFDEHVGGVRFTYPAVIAVHSVGVE